MLAAWMGVIARLRATILGGSAASSSAAGTCLDSGVCNSRGE